MSTGVLYISYDGMLEPLGQSQVLAYLEQLASGRRIHLLSFEKSEDWGDVQRREALRGRIAAAGIAWHPRRYHKHPSALATAWDVMVGIVTSLWLAWRYRLCIVHARSYVPALMALVLKRLARMRFLFDMRGFWADERVDGGLWPRNSRLYRIAKWCERRFLLRADHVVSLTHAGVAEMQRFAYLQGRMPPVTVIPTCADLSRFVPIDGQRDPCSFTLGYVGSASAWYLFDAAVEAFAALRTLRPDARLLVVNRGEHDHIRACLERAAIPEACVELQRADPAEMPALMARMDAAVFFIRPVFSKQASAPTKLAELLGCGVPVLSNSGVGDMAAILVEDEVGIAVSKLDAGSLQQGVRELLALLDQPGVRARCVDSARRHFALEAGVSKYAAIYGELADQCAS